MARNERKNRTNEITIDRLTLELIAMDPALKEQVLKALESSPDFMDVLGDTHIGPAGEIHLRIILWTPDKGIHRMEFPNGMVLGDLYLKMHERLPRSLEATIAGKPCSSILGHPLFDKYQWEGFWNEDQTMLRIHIDSDISLGSHPSSGLERAISARIKAA
jgi:hypothetical protein